MVAGPLDLVGRDFKLNPVSEASFAPKVPDNKAIEKVLRC